MKIAFTLLSLSLLMFSFGVTRPQGTPPASPVVLRFKVNPHVRQLRAPMTSCLWSMWSNSLTRQLRSLLVDLSGMWLSLANEQHAERNCATYRVRNNSDRQVQDFDVELSVGTLHGGDRFGTHPSSPLAPGQTVEIQSCGGA